MSIVALSVTFAALADPTRRAILARLAAGAATVKELSTPFAMSGPAVSKHLRVLERAGLISRGREAQWRPCRLEAASLRPAADWVEHYRHFWDVNFDRLDAHLSRMAASAAPPDATSASSGVASASPAASSGAASREEPGAASREEPGAASASPGARLGESGGGSDGEAADQAG